MAKKANERRSNEQQQPTASATPEKKGRPTPTRKEAQAANARPLVASRHDKAAVKSQRLAEREARERARVGMMHGDERFLSPRDKGPQRRFVRDYIDARFSVGEFMIPAMGAVLLMTFIPHPAFQVGSLVAIWVFVFVAITDALLLANRISKRIQAKFGADKLQSGTKFYVVMRALQLRVLRVPKPQVKRREFPK